jgi:hypothetical protein
MKYYKKPKYRLDARKVPEKTERDLTEEELYREILREKRKKAR